MMRNTDTTKTTIDIVAIAIWRLANEGPASKQSLDPLQFLGQLETQSPPMDVNPPSLNTAIGEHAVSLDILDETRHDYRRTK